jgi:hypothetical protein
MLGSKESMMVSPCVSKDACNDPSMFSGQQKKLRKIPHGRQ